MTQLASGPWEDFQTAPPAHGPWEDFTAPAATPGFRVPGVFEGGQLVKPRSDAGFGPSGPPRDFGQMVNEYIAKNDGPSNRDTGLLGEYGPIGKTAAVAVQVGARGLAAAGQQFSRIARGEGADVLLGTEPTNVEPVSLPGGITEASAGPASQANWAERMIGGLAGMGPSLAEPKAIAAMILTHAPVGTTMASPAIQGGLQYIAETVGAPVANAAESILHGAVGVGAFSGVHAGMEGGNVAQGAVEGAVQGGILGTAGVVGGTAIRGLRGVRPATTAPEAAVAEPALPPSEPPPTPLTTPTAVDPSEVLVGTVENRPATPTEPESPPEPIRAMGAASASELSGGGRELTGIKNAVSAEIRKRLGVGERQAPEARHAEEVLDEGNQIARGDPGAVDRLLNKLRADPQKMLSDKGEIGLLTHHRITQEVDLRRLVAENERLSESPDTADATHARIQLELHRAAMAETAELSERTGTASARSLAFRKIMAALDYSLGHMETEARAAKGGKPLTEPELVQVRVVHDKMAEAQKGIETAKAGEDSRAANAEADRAVRGLANEARKPETPTKRGGATKDPATKLADRIKDGESLSDLTDTLRQMALKMIRSGVKEREPLLDALHKQVEPLVPGVTREQVRDALSGYGNFIPLDKEAAKVRLREINTESQKLAQLEALNKGKPPLATGFERQSPTDEARALQKQVNEAKKKIGIGAWGPGRLKTAIEGAKTRIGNQIKDLQREIDMGTRTVKNKTAPLTDPELDALRKQRDALKELHTQAFGKPGMTDAQRLSLATRAAEQSAKAWEERLNRAQGGDFSAPAARAKQSSPEIEALRARAKAAREAANELRLLNDPAMRAPILSEIAALGKHLTAGTVPAKPRGPRSVPADIIDLRRKRDMLRNEVMRADPARRDSIRAQIADLERHIKNGTSPPPTAQRAAPADIQALRDKRDLLMKQARAGDPAWEAHENAEYRTRLAEREADLRDRIARNDFHRPAPERLRLDPQSQEAKARTERVRQEFDALKNRLAQQNRPPAVRALDMANRWVRAGVLSWPSVVEKLSGAAFFRGLSSPIENALQHVVGRADPALGAKMYDRAPTLRALVRSERAAVIGLATGGKDSVNLLRNRLSSLTATHEKVQLPPGILDYPQQLHAAIKNPTKQAAYERALSNLTETSILRGEDVTALDVRTRNATLAYRAAQREIFLQDNRAAQGFGSLLGRMEAVDKETGKPGPAYAVAALLRSELPIVKVPLNWFHETTQVLTGWLTGPARLAWAHYKGIENLQPVEASAIVRTMSKGSIGLGLLALGFFKPNISGGYYQPGERRPDEDLKAGEINLFGWHTRTFAHNPYFEAIHFGATLRHVMDGSIRGVPRSQRDGGVGTAMLAATAGVIDEVPFVREAVGIGKLRDPRTRDATLGANVASKIVPGVVQWIARQTDPLYPETPRRPHGVWESIKADIPGLRETVGTDKR